MKKGLLHEKKFNLKSPQLQKDLDQFIKEVGDRMKEHGIKQYVAAKKQEGDIVHMIIIPCSDRPADQAEVQKQVQELSATGFQASEVSSTNNLSNYASIDLEPVALQFNFDKKGPKT